jgi:8-oxo-dGTP diphosphatase
VTWVLGLGSCDSILKIRSSILENKNIRVRIAAIILNKKKELLLVNHVKHGRSYWLLPGGGIEFEEDCFSAIKRELKEELSLKAAKLGHLVFMNETIYPGGKRHILNLYFTVSLKGSTAPLVNPDGVLKGAAYVSKEEFRKILFYPAAKNDILNMWAKGFKEARGYIKTKWKK